MLSALILFTYEKIIFMVVIAALAAINVNLAFNSEESVIDLSLTSIMALARERLIFVRFAVMMLTLVIAI